MENHLTILVAEDDPTSQCLLQQMLTKWGFDVLVVADGTAAWDCVQKEKRPRLALLDIMMPGMDGLELCRRIRSIDGDDPLYIILVTALGQRDDVIEGFQAGADDYVTKPFDHHILRWRIDAGLRILQMREDLHEQNRRLTTYATEMEALAEQRAQQLMHADRLATVGTLSAGVAHEITNPVAYMAMNIRHLQQFWEDIEPRLQTCPENNYACILQEIPEIFTALNKGVNRIQRIVDGLRLYARRDTEISDQVNLNTCVEEALLLSGTRLKNQVHVTRDLDPNLPLMVGSEQEMEQVLVNLFINAADAMLDQTDATLHIQTTFQDEELFVHVTDNGPGIPAAIVDNVLKPFFTTKDPGKGTGMGLAICQSIIDNHQGHIKIQNRSEHGVRFTLSFPQAQSQDFLAAMQDQAMSP